MTYSDTDRASALRLGSSTLYEAAGLPTASVDPALRPVWEGAAVAGSAYPVECAPGDNLGIHLALEKIRPGDVLVVGASGFFAGYWGEVLTVAAQTVGVQGLVIDGGVRDVSALKALGFPVFARGVSMRGTVKASAPSVGRPISLSSTPVAPGDLVVADGDGVLILPAGTVPDVLAKGLEREEKERGIMDRLRSGETTLELFGLTRFRDTNP